MNFKDRYISLQNKINYQLENYLDMDNFEHLSYSQRIIDAMRYSIFAGGKRLRPILLISANSMVGGCMEESIPLACAIEMIHTYSLIHDDLPSMDDDEYRRGKPTNHMVYGEDIAILAGDALLNMAYEIMLDNANGYLDNINNHLKAMSIIASASGINGMISGQVADIMYQDSSVDSDLLEFIHRYKTGALIRASVLAGAILENIDDALIESIEIYGNNIGLAFQITDDMLDITGTFEKLGKKVGSDKKNKKNTYPLLFGFDESKRRVKALIEEAIDVLEPFGDKAEFLKQLARDIADRQS